MGITRREMYSRLQMLRLLEPLIENALTDRELQVWRSDLDPEDEPHGRPWHTSFHASSFPGDEKSCPRQALYTMLNTPQERPFSPKSRLMMEMGSTVEEAVVWGLYSYGILLSPPPSSPVQMGFVDPECWLTGNCDAVILHPRLKRPHVIECKMKYQKDLEKMRVGLLGPDPKHVVQVKTYICFLNLLSKHFWPELPELRDGSIYYVARDNPRLTAEFFVELDEEFREAGRDRLRTWKEWFEDDILPSQLAEVIPKDKNSKGQLVNSKRHPLGKEWKWGELPCKWCNYGQVCREDFKNDVTQLSESFAIGHSREIRGVYDYDEVREAVFAAWEEAGDEIQPANEVVNPQVADIMKDL